MLEEDTALIRKIRADLRLVHDDELRKEIQEILDMAEMYLLKARSTL